MDSVDEDLEPTDGQATPALHKSAELAGYARTFLPGSALPVETREELEASSPPPVCCQAALGWRSCAFAGRGEREIGVGVLQMCYRASQPAPSLGFPTSVAPKSQVKIQPNGAENTVEGWKGQCQVFLG